MRDKRNYLDFVPVKNPQLPWQEDEGGIVTVEVTHRGIAAKVAQVRHPGYGGRVPAQGGQVRPLRRCDDRHRDRCPRGGLRGRLCGQPCRHPLPDGLRQAP